MTDRVRELMERTRPEQPTNDPQMCNTERQQHTNGGSRRTA